MVLRFKWESRSPPFLLAGEDFFLWLSPASGTLPPPLPPRPVLFIPSFRFPLSASLLPSFLPGPFPAFSFILLPSPPPCGSLFRGGRRSGRIVEGGAGGWVSRQGFFALKGRGRALLENAVRNRRIMCFSCVFARR